MGTGTPALLSAVHGELIDVVSSQDRVRLLELVERVGRKLGVNSEQVTAAVWDLVQEDRLRYGADAYVSASKE
jgi:hypothetical protein